MITKITEKQQKIFDDLIQKYLNDITEFPPMDLDKTKEAVNEIYESMGYKKPTIIVGKNPYETALMCAMLKINKDSQIDSQLCLQLDSQLRSQLCLQLDLQLRSQLCLQLRSQLCLQLDLQLRSQLGSQLVSQLDLQLGSQLGLQLVSQLDLQLVSQLDLQLVSQLGSQLDSQLVSINTDWYQPLWWRFWDCYYQFARQIGIKFDNQKLELFNKFLTDVYFCIPYDGICFVSEPPIRTHWNDKKQLHSEGTPSVEFKSSIDSITFGVWSLNGVKVPQYLAETPSSQLDIDWFLKEKNADVKAEFIRKYGIERMVSLGKVIDTYENHKYSKNYEWYEKSQYKLIDMSSLFTTYGYLPYLYMKNLTVDGIYHLECCYNPNLSKQAENIIEGLTVRMNGINPENSDIIGIA